MSHLKRKNIPSDEYAEYKFQALGDEEENHSQNLKAVHSIIDTTSLQQESNQSPKGFSLAWITNFLFGVLPLIIACGTFLLFAFNDEFKLKVTNTFASLHNNLNFEIFCYLLLYGALLIFLSFPYVIYELCLGYTFSFPIAFTIAVVAKLIGEAFCFTITRYCLKGCCQSFLKDNNIFNFLLKASYHHPWTVSHLLRSSFLIPLVVLNFGCGILQITFIQYIVPALIWGSFYSTFTVFAGSQLSNLSQVMENSGVPQNTFLLIFEISMLVFSLIATGIMIFKGYKIYEDLEKEVEKEEETKMKDSSTKMSSSINNQLSIESPVDLEENDENIEENHKPKKEFYVSGFQIGHQ